MTIHEEPLLDGLEFLVPCMNEDDIYIAPLAYLYSSTCPHSYHVDPDPCPLLE